jgi:hypothetical protein
MHATRIKDVWRKDLPRIVDPRGNLTFIESGYHVPFSIERVFWIYDVPGGESRGGHADRVAEEFIIAVSGSFRVVVDDGVEQLSFMLNRSYTGLYVPPRIWRHLDDFSTNSVALILNSRRYEPATYVRDYEQFRRLKKTEQA